MTVPERLARALSGRYVVERELGRGGMATVYLAHDVRHDRAVAIKLLQPQADAARGAERFLREIRIAARLQHPHILPVFDSGALPDEGGHGSEPYFVMPYVGGESLAHLLARERKLPVSTAVRIAAEVADALGYAHAQGIVHRDVKPGNILLDAGHAVVADFGIARAVSAAVGERMTAAGVAMGTPAYMSPEQVVGADAVDGRSDIYSLGCVLHEMLTGEPPFQSDTVQGTLSRRLVETAPPVRQLRPEVSEALEGVLARAMAIAPGARFATASEFAAALEGTVTTLPTATVPASRRRTVVAGVGLLVAGLAAAAALIVRRAPEPESAPPAAIAVLPFTVRGSPAIAYLGEGMMDLLSTKLDGVGGLRSVDPRALLGALGRDGTSQLGLEEGRKVARRFGAGRFILGEVVEAGGQLQLSAGLYTPDREAPVTRAQAAGDADRLFELVDSLAARLLGALSPEQSRVTQLAFATTASLPALRAYLEGEVAFRRGSYDSAVAAFQHAAALDSSFALAWYRLSIAAEWLTQDDLATAAAEQATLHADRLASRDQAMLQALVATRLGRTSEAERIYRTLTGAHPDDVEAWIQLAEITFHTGPARGRPASESREPWERAMALDPSLLSARLHLARVAAAERRMEELDAHLAAVEAVRRGGTETEGDSRQELLEIYALRASLRADTAAFGETMAALAQASDVTAILSMWMVVNFAEDLAGGEAMAAVLTAPARGAAVRAVGHGMAAYVQAAQGRWGDARRSLAQATDADRFTGAIYGADLLGSPVSDARPAELDSLRRLIGRLPPGTLAPVQDQVGASVYFTALHDYWPAIQPYLAGILSARLGDSAAAATHARRLEVLGQGRDPIGLAHRFAHGVRAAMAVQAGRPADVLRQVEAEGQEMWYLIGNAGPSLSGGRERFLRAWALERTGRPEEAAYWYDSFKQYSIVDMVYRAEGLRRQAAIFGRLGRSADSASAMARVESLVASR